MPAFSDEEMLDRLRLRSYLHAVRRRWLSVLIVTVVIAGIGLALSLAQSPSYRAHADVELEPTAADITKNNALDSIDIATQVQLVNSLGVADQVQQDLNMWIVPTSPSRSPRSRRRIPATGAAEP